MPGPLLAIDGPFVLYRSFFALPDSITGGDDHPVNALLGAVNLILRIAAERRPGRSSSASAPRPPATGCSCTRTTTPQRPPVPDALAWQFERAPELFEAVRLGDDAAPTTSRPTTCSARWPPPRRQAGGRALIMTGDRDMYQCAGERVSVVYLKQGSSGFEEVDPAEVRKRYGIGPELVPDFIALRGDPSDGLPGAPGIGAKTAAELLQRHGSLEAAIAAAGQERPRDRRGAARARRRAAGVPGHRHPAHGRGRRCPPTARPTWTAGPRRRAASA